MSGAYASGLDGSQEEPHEPLEPMPATPSMLTQRQHPVVPLHSRQMQQVVLLARLLFCHDHHHHTRHHHHAQTFLRLRGGATDRGLAYLQASTNWHALQVCHPPCLPCRRHRVPTLPMQRQKMP